MAEPITADSMRQHCEDTYAAYQEIMAEVFAELATATFHFGPMRSAHEGWAVLYEEVDEMWDEVKADNLDLALAEAKQVAAVALRFIHDMQALKAAEAGG